MADTLSPSAEQVQSAATIAGAGTVGNTASGIGNMNSGALAPTGSNSATAIPSGLGGNGTADGTVGAGAAPTPPAATDFQIAGKQTDLRVRIKVPDKYNTQFTNAGKAQRGIIFPYTPQIGIEYKADYSSQNPMHSNYAIHFYKSSSISDISIQGIFTVQNDTDAMALLSTINLLRALTKGRFGHSDSLSGAPPPICRLMAYGNYMLDNVPVSIASFKQDLTTDVDYYFLAANKSGNPFGAAMVPIKSTISIVCKPMFSRQEMLDATVPSWLAGQSRSKGLL